MKFFAEEREKLRADILKPVYHWTSPFKLLNDPNGLCFFKGRCNKRCGKCAGKYPKEIKVSETHSVFCHLYDEEGEGE